MGLNITIGAEQRHTEMLAGDRLLESLVSGDNYSLADLEGRLSELQAWQKDADLPGSRLQVRIAEVFVGHCREIWNRHGLIGTSRMMVQYE